jgi:hypothetical protein
MTMNERTRLAPLLLAVVAVVGLLTAAASPAANGKATATLPAACKLLKRVEAQTLAGIRLQPPVNGGTNCTYNSYPTTTVAQVAIYVDSTVPRTLQIDRKLGHKIWKVPRLGDQAFEEEWHIFVRKGKVWITINLVRTEAWPPYQKRLERAARIAVSRIKPPTRLAAARRPTVVALPPASGGRERWTGKERRFGGSVTHYAGVVYQPSVVVIGGGARAIRSRGADGLTWTIDAKAPGASDLRVGKIMLATTLAAGRVLKLTRAGRDLRVVLGPASLTDVIRDGTFASTAPIPLRKPLGYETALPKRHRRASGAAGSAANFNTDAFWRDGGGLGVSVTHDGPTGRLAATVQFYVGRPNVTFHIRIGGGRLIDAGVEVHGVGGLRYEFFGATLDSSGNVRSGPIPVGESFTFPLVGPLAITLSQAFDVSMQFSGRATVRSRGDYVISGTLGFGYEGGGPTRKDASLTKTARARVPMTENTLSLGVGANALSLGWKVRAMVGIGAAGFAAGAWGELHAGLGLRADGSNLLSLKLGCAGVAFDVTSYYGVGYSIPDYVESVVNFFLRLVKAKPIASNGGPSWGPFAIWKPPQAEWCPPRKPPSAA